MDLWIHWKDRVEERSPKKDLAWVKHLLTLPSTDVYINMRNKSQFYFVTRRKKNIFVVAKKGRVITCLYKPYNRLKFRVKYQLKKLTDDEVNKVKLMVKLDRSLDWRWLYNDIKQSQDALIALE